MGSLVTAAQAAYNTWKESNPSSIEGWEGLTDAEIAAMFRDDQMYQQAVKDAQMIEDSFYAARTQAFTDLEASQLAARTALSQAWQTKEDAGFDVDA